MIKKLLSLFLLVLISLANEENFTLADYFKPFFYKVGYDENGYFIKRYDLESKRSDKKYISLKESDLFLYDMKIINGYSYLSGTYKEQGIVISLDEDLNEKFTIPQIDDKRYFFTALDKEGEKTFLAGGAVTDITPVPYFAILSENDKIETEKYFPNLENGWFTKIKKTENYLYIGGVKQNIKSRNDTFLLKTDKNGNEIKRRSLSTKKDDFLKEIAIAGDGNIYALCESWGDLEGMKNEGFSDVFLIKLDKNLQTIWKKRLSTPYADTPATVQIGEKYLYVGILNSTYFSYSLSYPGKNSFVVKIDKNGNQIWSQPFDIKNLLKIRVQANELVLIGEEDKIINLNLLNKRAFIKKIYSLLFDRTPKEHELRYWEKYIDSENALIKALSYFYDCDEFSQKREELSTAAFIKLSYRALLNREADKAGMKYWQNFDKEKIWKKMLRTKEFKEKTKRIL